MTKNQHFWQSVLPQSCTQRQLQQQIIQPLQANKKNKLLCDKPARRITYYALIQSNQDSTLYQGIDLLRGSTKNSIWFRCNGSSSSASCSSFVFLDMPLRHLASISDLLNLLFSC